MEDERNLETALADEAAGNTDVPREGHGPASQVVASAAAAGDEVADGHEDNSKAPLAPPDHHQQHANFAAAHNPAGHAPAAAAGAASHLPFVAPSDLLRVSQFRPASRASSASASVRSRPGTASSADTTARASKPMPYQDREQIEGLRAIRAFLKVRTSYDVLPLSYRLIVFDTSLLVKKSLNILTQCGTYIASMNVRPEVRLLTLVRLQPSSLRRYGTRRHLHSRAYSLYPITSTSFSTTGRTRKSWVELISLS